jgi:hypothetical protein
MYNQCLGKYSYDNPRPYASVFVDDGCTLVDPHSVNHLTMHPDVRVPVHYTRAATA